MSLSPVSHLSAWAELSWAPPLAHAPAVNLPDDLDSSCDSSVYAHRSSLVLRFSDSSVTPICFPGGVEWSESE